MFIGRLWAQSCRSTQGAKSMVEPSATFIACRWAQRGSSYVGLLKSVTLDQNLLFQSCCWMLFGCKNSNLFPRVQKIEQIKSTITRVNLPSHIQEKLQLQKLQSFGWEDCGRLRIGDLICHTMCGTCHGCGHPPRCWCWTWHRLATRKEVMPGIYVHIFFTYFDVNLDQDSFLMDTHTTFQSFPPLPRTRWVTSGSLRRGWYHCGGSSLSFCGAAVYLLRQGWKNGDELGGQKILDWIWLKQKLKHKKKYNML